MTARAPDAGRPVASLHPEHVQGDVVLADGARLLTCTKVLRNHARAAMLFVPGLFRLDVHSQDDSFAVDVRPLGEIRLQSSLGRHIERAGRAVDGTPLKITEFVVRAPDSDLGPIQITVSLPAVARVYEFPCTALALVPAGS